MGLLLIGIFETNIIGYSIHTGLVKKDGVRLYPFHLAALNALSIVTARRWRYIMCVCMFGRIWPLRQARKPP